MSADPDAPWRRWVADRGLYPFEVLLQVRDLYAVQVPSHPDRAPLKLGDIDKRVDELRPMILEAVSRLLGEPQRVDNTTETEDKAETPPRRQTIGGVSRAERCSA